MPTFPPYYTPPPGYPPIPEGYTFPPWFTPPPGFFDTNSPATDSTPAPISISPTYGPDFPIVETVNGVLNATRDGYGIVVDILHISSIAMLCAMALVLCVVGCLLVVAVRMRTRRKSTPSPMMSMMVNNTI